MSFVALPRRSLRRRAAGFHKLGYYHFYLFDTEGKVHVAASMQCHDDLDAIERAPFELRRSGWHPVIEVWHGLRLVERIGDRLPS